jgi:hypothetical protein
MYLAERIHWRAKNGCLETKALARKVNIIRKKRIRSNCMDLIRKAIGSWSVNRQLNMDRTGKMKILFAIPRHVAKHVGRNLGTYREIDFHE